MMRKRLSPLLLLCGMILARGAFAQTPQINAGGAVNGASFAPASDPSGALAPGTIFSIFGSSLTDGTTDSAMAFPLPARLAGARVLVNGTEAALFFASPGQINAQFPVELTGITSASLRVEVQRGVSTLTSSPITVTVAEFSPGIFTLDQDGRGPGAILRNDDFSAICPRGRTDCTANPAALGEVVAIFLTGLGAVDGVVVSGERVQTAFPTLATPQVTIGGIAAEVLFSGLATGFAGLYQMNVTVPGNAPRGDNVPVRVTIEGVSSNQVTLATPALACQPGSLTPFREIRALAVDPGNPSTVYAGSPADGILLSCDQGATWSQANAGLDDTSVLSLAVDPLNPAVIYAGTSFGGVFKSVNGAQSWAAVNTGLPETNIPALAVNPSSPSTVYAGAAFGGVFKTTNGGQSWTSVNAGLFDNSIRALAINPSNPSTVYAGTAFGGVFRTTNGGQSWTTVNTGISDTSIRALAIDPSSPATVYAATASGGVFKTTNSGASWAAFNNGLSNAQTQTLAVDGRNPSTIYVGTAIDGVFKSTNRGQNWTAASAGLANFNIQALAVDPSDSSRVYAGSLTGIFRSVNGGQSWQ